MEDKATASVQSRKFLVENVDRTSFVSETRWSQGPDHLIYILYTKLERTQLASWIRAMTLHSLAVVKCMRVVWKVSDLDMKMAAFAIKSWIRCLHMLTNILDISNTLLLFDNRKILDNIAISSYLAMSSLNRAKTEKTIDNKIAQVC